MRKNVRIYNGDKTVSSINDVGKPDLNRYMQKNETGPLFYTIYKKSIQNQLKT